MATKLCVLKGAPEVLPPDGYVSEKWHEKLCISPAFYDGSPSYHARCRRQGTIETDKGFICVQHAKSWARRGWLNVIKLRAILEKRAREEARRSAKRACCLRRGTCL